MKKTLYIFREMLHMIMKERLFVLAAVLVALALVAFIVYQVTPVTVVTFIYAGI